MTAFADVVAASEEVAQTSRRSRKVAILGELLCALDPAEVPICVGFLSGVPRQGRVGIGYAAIRDLAGGDADRVNGAALTVGDVDGAIAAVEAATGRDRPRRGERSWSGCSPGPPDRRRTSSAACSPAACARARWPGSWPTRWPRRPGYRGRSLAAA
jgi:hypothetical protein